MTFLTGLDAVNKYNEERKGGYSDLPKANWLQLKDGDEFKLIMLQEIDKSSPNYSEKNGLALFVYMHSNPDNWQKSARCTADQDDCYGCRNNWPQKLEMLINVLVNESEVAILKRAVSRSSYVNTLIKMAGDEDYENSITDKVFKLGREGSGKDNTKYTLNPLPKAHSKNVEDYELFDLEQYVFTVKPENQEKFYTNGQEAQEDASKPAAAVSATSIDSDW